MILSAITLIKDFYIGVLNSTSNRIQIKQLAAGVKLEPTSDGGFILSSASASTVIRPAAIALLEMLPDDLGASEAGRPSGNTTPKTPEHSDDLAIVCKPDDSGATVESGTRKTLETLEKLKKRKKS